MKSVSGNIVNLINATVVKGHLYYQNGKITSIVADDAVGDQYIIPGLVDAHIHIESSMMLPTEFARHSLIHGTVACVCDAHEIANVCGVDGVDYMIENSKHSPMKFYFGAPSCVPSTPFESSGARVDAPEIEKMLMRDDIYFLAEMMDFQGVVHANKEVNAKLNAAKRAAKPIDGHAPELHGADLIAYASSGITTDHECMTIAEAEAKIDLGMIIQIREGSAAKNFDDLLPLIQKYPDKIMFCSDDKHPNDLLRNGHINTLVRRALAKGYDAIAVLRICSLIPIKHYKLDIGLLQVGDDADFLVIDNLTDFNIQKNVIKGHTVVENGLLVIDPYESTETINNFCTNQLTADQLKVQPSASLLKVIQVEDGQLYTTELHCEPTIIDNNIVSDVVNDVLKMVVVNRYQNASPAIGFIKNIGLKRGALASTVSHDSHNIVAVGTTDEEIAEAINMVIQCKGGIVAVDADDKLLLPLPIAGLMSNESGEIIAEKYEQIDAMAKKLGSKLTSPFMTLAFMSLLVIPELKLSDKGLFDGRTFQFTSLML